MVETNEVKELLLSVKREGMEKLVEVLERQKYFECAASTRFHGNYPGGLVDHCYNIYTLMKHLLEKFKAEGNNEYGELSEESLIICAFMHDLCKVGAYTENGGWNRAQPSGHATLSLIRLKKFIKLTQQEEEIIKYHMGMYGTNQFLGLKGEYGITDLSNCFNVNKLAKLFYFCDDMAAQFLDVKR